MGQERRDRWRGSLREPPATHEPEDQFLATYRLELTQDGCQAGGIWGEQLVAREAPPFPQEQTVQCIPPPRPVFSMVSTDKLVADSRHCCPEDVFKRGFVSGG